nr:DUF6270 domain-containing protein [Segeticoccus rhizosphaerae]
MEPEIAIRTFIYGSCVSRDSFEYFDGDRYALSAYVARQSLISAFGKAGDPGVDLSKLTSPFQRRIVQEDVASGLSARLRAKARQVDLLLWDLVDERLGVYIQDDGGVVTRSVELLTAQRESNRRVPGRLVAFDSREHRELWSVAVGRWLALLRELDLLERTVLLAPAWAERTTEGRRTPASFGISAKQANRATAGYVTTVRRQCRIRVIEIGQDLARAAEGHKWGIAPFHYDAAVYRSIASAVEDLEVAS